jgi:uncharacterized Ntn-hydrolase superfamily protein
MPMPVPSTFSVAAVDRETGDVGVAVQSKFLSVGAMVPWVRAGVGAVATQAFCNTSYGPRGLDLLATGMSPDDVAAALVADDDGRDDRQFGLVDMHGGAATYTGAKCIGYAGGIVGDGFAAQGNCLASAAVVDALAGVFAAGTSHLADRLIAALRAAQVLGGDKRGQQSAALIIERPGGGYGGFNARAVDLRVDDHVTPIEELAHLLELHKLYFFAPQPHEIVRIDDVLGREIAGELVRVGALDAADDYDARVASALVTFMHVENLENRVRDDGTIDLQTLTYLRAHKRSA